MSNRITDIDPDFGKEKDEKTDLKDKIKELKEKSTVGDDEISLIKTMLDDSKLRRDGIYELARFCLNKFHILTLSDTEEVFVYNDGVYEPNGEKLLSSFVQQELGLDESITTHIINELIGHIHRLTYKKREDVEEPKDKVCLANGILNLTTLEVQPHSPDVVFFNKISMNYSSAANCPIIKKFFNEIVEGDDVLVLQEFFGYCLYKGYPISKAMMLVGEGSNGKSTLISLLKLFLGKQNCSSIPLQQLESDRFAMSNLFGKLVNMFADLSPKALKDTSFFKMLTGNDLIPAQKKFKSHFFFVNYAKLIFSCNQLPRSPDESDAFFRRWVMINFPNQFVGSADDKHLLQKLTSSEELSGLLNWAIGGLKRLLANGDFTNGKATQEVREAYIRMSDSVAAFILDLVEIASDAFIPKKELYTAYADYCRAQKCPVVAENTFHRWLQAKIRVEDYRPSLNVDGKLERVQCWKGIKLNDNPVNDVGVNKHLEDAGKVEEIKIEDNADKVDNPDKSVKDVKDVSPDSYLTDDRPTDEDYVEFVRERGQDGYPLAEFFSRYGKAALERLLQKGMLVELPAGMLRLPA